MKSQALSRLRVGSKAPSRGRMETERDPRAHLHSIPGFDLAGIIALLLHR